MELVEQLRQLLPRIDAALLTDQDRVALVDLLAAVYAAQSDSAVANFG